MSQRSPRPPAGTVAPPPLRHTPAAGKIESAKRSRFLLDKTIITPANGSAGSTICDASTWTVCIPFPACPKWWFASGKQCRSGPSARPPATPWWTWVTEGTKYLQLSVCRTFCAKSIFFIYCDSTMEDLSVIPVVKNCWAKSLPWSVRLGFDWTPRQIHRSQALSNNLYS